MAKKLFVGGLSFDTTQQALQDAFAQAGAVSSVTIPVNKMNGQPRGFGFVEMASDADAEKAIEMWNGKELDGRRLTVNEARPMGDRPPRQGGFRNQRGNW